MSMELTSWIAREIETKIGQFQPHTRQNISGGSHFILLETLLKCLVLPFSTVCNTLLGHIVTVQARQEHLVGAEVRIGREEGDQDTEFTLREALLHHHLWLLIQANFPVTASTTSNCHRQLHDRKAENQVAVRDRAV